MDSGARLSSSTAGETTATEASLGREVLLNVDALLRAELEKFSPDLATVAVPSPSVSIVEKRGRTLSLPAARLAHLTDERALALASVRLAVAGGYRPRLAASAAQGRAAAVDGGPGARTSLGVSLRVWAHCSRVLRPATLGRSRSRGLANDAPLSTSRV
jgi:hypothetical protein